MSEFVIDASAALAWLVRTQSTPASGRFLEVRDNNPFVAPYIFSWEVSNALLSLFRRGALSSTAHEQVLMELDGLEIRRQPAVSEVEIEAIATFARNVGLTLFDAAYLTLAEERAAPIVSRDERLLAAAAAHGVPYVDLRERTSP